jgi:hypothetical protein
LNIGAFRTGLKNPRKWSDETAKLTSMLTVAALPV